MIERYCIEFAKLALDPIHQMSAYVESPSWIISGKSYQGSMIVNYDSRFAMT